MSARVETIQKQARAPEHVSGRSAHGRVRSWIVTCLLVDVAMLATAAGIATASSRSPQPITLPWLVFYAAVTIVGLAAFRGYRPRLRLEILEELRGVLTATAVAAMTLIAVHEVTSADQVDGSEAVRLWGFSCVYLAAGRAGLVLAQLRARRSLVAGTPTLVVGAGRIGRLTARRLLDNPELGLRPIGFLDKDPIEIDGEDAPVPVLGASWDLERLVQEHDVGHVVITFSSAPHHIFLSLLSRCEQLGLRVSTVPRLFERLPTRLAVTHVGGLPLLELRPTNPRGVQYAVKYAADRVFAAFALVLLSPVLVAAAGAVLVSLGRPILYRQRRIGRDGRPFEMLKFRTMHGGPEQRGEADAAWALAQMGRTADDAPAFASSDGDRRTRVGTFLRRASIDELAQLINVLRGEMSFVGPRPERQHYVREFEREIYRYGERHRVKSGLTGWAQVHGLRGKTSLADRVEWDNYYIENFSLWLDLKIMLMTLPEVFGLRSRE
jgi:exopolysaccharide biosynthesis polyprenyl glycosylphosphotransferase